MDDIPDLHSSIDRAGHTVLVVDDNPATLYTTARVVRSAGFRVVEASNGTEALALCRGGSISAVVLDVHLPDIDGFQVCRAIRADASTRLLPVIHLSAEYVKDEDHVAGLNAGADGYLVHPVEPAVLVATLQALVRARLAEEELRKSERQLLEREQAARAQAERHSRTMDDFIAVLSHELRTPLNAIVGWAEILKRRDITPEGRKGIEAIERNAKTQARIISDILDVSRINSGKLQLERQWVDPAELVRTSLVSLEAAANDRRIRIEVDVDGAHAPAWLDPARYQQILWNLLTNAIKFSPEDGRVEVSLVREGNHLGLTVRDFGPGMDPEFLPHAFDRFTQSDSPGNRRHGGLGLGLAIVKQLGELHGGQVGARDGGPGGGTLMWVDLPADRPASAPADPAGAPPATAEPPVMAGDLHGVDVLVVEDDREAAEIMALTLGDRGARVRIAADCDSALAELRRSWPQAVVSDIGLPGRDGYELARSIRALQPAGRPRLPLVALTAFARPQDRRKSLEAGFDLHLAKPLEPHHLLSGIARLLGRTGS